ncbi:phosphatase PAP2 family protein [Streptomyces sp. NPDC020096]
MSSTAARAGAAPRSRPRWWAELPLIALIYAAYSAGRLLVAGGTGTAVTHGESILRIERALHIDPEHTLNGLFTHASWLGIPACFCYATLHYLVTPGVLVWLWRRHGDQYLFMRTWLMISTLIGLIGFSVLPTAPPRLLPPGSGFHDTLAQYAAFGWWGADASAPQGLGDLTNQYAAMPSLHVGWALWCGAILWRCARTRWVRALGVAYPLVIALVVLGTANHYLLDALAGGAVMGLGLLLTPSARWLTSLRRGHRSAVPAAASYVGRIPAPRRESSPVRSR